MAHANFAFIPKARNTHSEHVILLFFPLQQWLHESASVLRCKFIACLVANIKINEFMDIKQQISLLLFLIRISIGELAELRKETISFVMPVCLSIRMSGDPKSINLFPVDGLW